MHAEPASTGPTSQRADDAPLPTVAVGELVDGRYRVDEVIGSGAMGVVVRATHVELGEARAIKFMRWSSGGTDRRPALDRRAAERFVREARAASGLASPHVARVFDLGRTADGLPFIVMEHLEGYDLRARVEDGGTLRPVEAVAFAVQALHGLAEANARGIVHRDLKPSNLFVATGGRPAVKILDFGIAKVRPDADRGAAAGGEVTRDSDILGSPLYMAPEQVRATRDVDARADVWSLGVILFVTLTGSHPFGGATVADILVEVLTKPAPDVRALRADVPPPLARVVSRCLAKDRDARPSSAEALARLLVDAIDDREGLRGLLLPDVDAWVDALPPVSGPAPSSAPPASAGDARPTPVFAAPDAPVFDGGATLASSPARVVPVADRGQPRARRRIIAGVGGVAVVAGAIVIAAVSALRATPRGGAEASAPDLTSAPASGTGQDAASARADEASAAASLPGAGAGPTADGGASATAAPNPSAVASAAPTLRASSPTASAVGVAAPSALPPSGLQPLPAKAAEGPLLTSGAGEARATASPSAPPPPPPADPTRIRR